MVLTQLQLKWPNHSTHLLTGLKSLFKNEQLVDCTLKCNKHTLKVHRSVLAACSPYFERELENNPFIVIRDMQFNVLQALIEFMYYGETRISEESFASLIEAAKLFEVKGLSEVDILTSAETNNIISSIITASGVNYEKSSSMADHVIFERNIQPEMKATCKSRIPNAMSNGSGEIDEDSNSNITIADESANSDSYQQQHACRNFVVTPPQTESAQILLSLARSYNEQQFFNSAATSTQMPAIADQLRVPVVPVDADDHDYHLEEAVGGEIKDEEAKERDGRVLFSDNSNTIDNELPITTSREDDRNFESTSNIVVIEQQLVAAQSFRSVNDDNDARTSSSIITTANSAATSTSTSSALCAASAAVSSTTIAAVPSCVKCNSLDECDDEFGVPEKKSLLAKLLTRNGQSPRSKFGSGHYDENYKNLCQASSTNSQNQSCPGAAKNNFELQSDIILECPFLIETNDGYVDMTVDNMLNVFENGEVFDPSLGKSATAPMPAASPTTTTTTTTTTSSEIVTPEMACINVDVDIAVDRDQIGGGVRGRVESYNNDNDVLERIRREEDENDELKEDPGAVVIRHINENGQLTKYVLSSADISTLKTMIEKRKQRPSVTSAAHEELVATDSSHIEVELPSNGGSASLITRIISAGMRVQNAISKLPFKRSDGADGGVTGGGGGGLDNDVGFVTTETSNDGGCCRGGGDRILDETSSLAVEATHHHENMFEELDNQFNMDCSIENIQREYVAYEEASKNETQLDHNYYANAMKDEDEECVVINDNYDLGSLMLIEEPVDGIVGSANHLASLSNNNSRRKNANVLLPPSLSNSFGLIASGAGDRDCSSGVGPFVNICDDGQPIRRNGAVNKVVSVSVSLPVATSPPPPPAVVQLPLQVSLPVPLSGSLTIPIFNGKCDLVLNNDAIMNSVLNTTMLTTSAAAVATTTISAFNTATPTTISISSRPSSSSTTIASDGGSSDVLTTKPRIVNGAFRGSKPFGNGGDSKRKTPQRCSSDHGAIALPFKKVKNSKAVAVACEQREKKLRRAFRRRSSSSNEGSGGVVGVETQNEHTKPNASANVFYENDDAIGNSNLVEEVIVDEIS